MISVKEITVSWDPNLHMAIHERIQEATQDSTDLKGCECDLTLPLPVVLLCSLKHKATISFYLSFTADSLLQCAFSSLSCFMFASITQIILCGEESLNSLVNCHMPGVWLVGSGIFFLRFEC